MVVGLAGVGLLGGIPMIAGVLLGAGAASLIRRREEAATEPPAEARGRMRRILSRTSRDLHELKQRARAVMLAARGEIGAPPEAAREGRARSQAWGATPGGPA